MNEHMNEQSAVTEEVTRDFVLAAGGLVAEIDRAGHATVPVVTVYAEGWVYLMDMRRYGPALFTEEQLTAMVRALAAVTRQIRRRGIAFPA